MSILKCKYCGNDIEISEQVSTTLCPTCQNNVSVPILNSEKKLSLYNIATRLRFIGDYNKALKVYSTIKNSFDEVEVYIGLILVKYGIMYQDNKLICNVVCEESIYENKDYLHALDIADEDLLDFLDDFGKKVEEARLEMLNYAKTFKSYDITILVNDENRKSDGYLVAKEMYEILSAEGRKVFFPTHVLKNLEGRDKEAQLYCALKSSKMLILFAKSIEKLSEEKLMYYTNKYLDIMDNDDNHTFLPCFENIAYSDVPERIKSFSIIDLASESFIDNIMDSVDNVFKPVKQELSREEKLVRKGNKLLASKDFTQALKYANAAIEENEEYEDGYLLGLLASLSFVSEEELIKNEILIDDNKYYLDSLNKGLKNLEELSIKIKDSIYNKALTLDKNSQEFVDTLSKIKGYKDADDILASSYDGVYKGDYDRACTKFERGISENYEIYLKDALAMFEELPLEYRDVEEKIKEVKEALSNLEDDACKEFYDKGIEIYKNATSIDDYKRAQNEFMKVLSYKDTKNWNIRCKEKMYTTAGALYGSDKVEDLIVARDTFKFLYPYKDSLYYYEQAAAKVSMNSGKKKKK